MSAQHPPGVDGQAQLFSPPPPPDYSRRFVLNLAGSAASLGISTVAHIDTASGPLVPETGEQSAVPTLIWMLGSAGWLTVTVGWIALRELRYGFNRLFTPVVINHHHYHLPDPPPQTGNGKRGSKRRSR
ncbi:hypothetical protein [Nocardia fluminea]|uniref:hypothetical protein n=1 Tax=Nocardia fluminea TaxID=134984 RepID=UPI003D0C58B3